MNCRRYDFFRSYSTLLLCCAALLATGCLRDQSPKVLEIAYVRGGGVPLRDQLGPSSGQVKTLEGGEKVDVLAKRNRWVQVRLEGGRTGWVHSRFLAPAKIFDQFRQLEGEAAALPPQGKALIRRESNLHLDASVNSDTFYRLTEREQVDILTHRIAERADRPGSSASQAAAESDSAPEGAAEVEVKGNEDWFLVRAPGGRAGWLRESALDVSPPIEIARYNEGLRIRAWFEIFKEQDQGQVHPWYLWATIHPRPGLPFDYDEIRVFVWNPKKSRYETSYRERNLIGFYPIQVRTEDTPAGPSPAFSLQVEDPSGRRFKKRYVMNGRLVRSVS